VILIQKSKTADTRSCDFANVSKDTLRNSSIQHISDVRKGIELIKAMLETAAKQHDFDKLSDLDGFHSDFVGGFKNTTWWDNHRKINRHHLLQQDGVRDDVNLVDVIDMIVDCVMAGMGRTGTVYPVNIPTDVLKLAFDNTVALMTANVAVEGEETPSMAQEARQNTKESPGTSANSQRDETVGASMQS
jgi:protein tyrosine phosphatase